MLQAVGERTFRSSIEKTREKGNEGRRLLSRSSRHSLSGLFRRSSQLNLEQPLSGDSSDGSGKQYLRPEVTVSDRFSTDFSQVGGDDMIQAGEAGGVDGEDDQASTDSDELLMVESYRASREQDSPQKEPLQGPDHCGDNQSIEAVGVVAEDDAKGTYAANAYRAIADDETCTNMPIAMGRAPTFSVQYNTKPAPGSWESNSLNASAYRRLSRSPSHPNVPLEPEEVNQPSMPWLVEQMKMGEQPFSSLFENDTTIIANMDEYYGCNENEDVTEDQKDDAARRERKRRRKLAFEVLKKRVSEVRVGIPREPPVPKIEQFQREDGTVDYTRYGGSLLKHYADTQFRHKLDYRHDSRDPCKLDKFITTLQRLVEVSAPYQRFLVWLYKLARWDSPRVSLWWCAVYFFLLYHGMLAMFLWLTPVFITAYYRLRPNHAQNWLAFERPETSIIPSKVLHEASSGTIGKGLVANRLWDLWRETLGAHVHIYLADVADLMERAKNCATWQRPWASRSVMMVMTGMALFVYIVPASVFQKLFGLCFGIQFFLLAPLQLRYQRYRRLVWIVDGLLWNCPTDIEVAVDTLYTQSLRHKKDHQHQHHHHEHEHDHDHAESKAEEKQVNLPEDSSKAKPTKGPREYLRTIVADMKQAYYPLEKRRHPPITILQTASSASLDRLGDETDDSSDINAVHEALLMGRRIGKKILLGANDPELEDDRYTGLGAVSDSCNNSSIHLPAMMGPGEEQEWMAKSGLFKPISRTYSVDSLVSMDKRDYITRPTKIQHTRKVSDEDVPSIILDSNPLGYTSNSSGSGGTSGTESSGGVHGVERRGSGSGRSLLTRAKNQLASKLRRSRDHHQGAATTHAFLAGRRSSVDERPALGHSMAIPTGSNYRGLAGKTLSSIDLAGFQLDEGQDMKIYNTSTANPTNTLATSSGGPSRSRGVSEATYNSLTESTKSRSLELTHEANELAALRNKNAQSTKNGVDLSSLYAFRCIHRGKYGTLFVTADRFVFRRSRIMGGRRSSVSSYLLSNVVAIRKSTGRFGKLHGIQMLLNDGKPYYFYGLPKRDDVFGFLLVRCGNSHAY
ncbi:hypothetical protein GGI07_003017 [Coemansia sp. Benny D115]|nr:hypothetical protein GGI07_003017 [Coemansia sp. Benny D115]